jgi:hypothetical protein
VGAGSLADRQHWPSAPVVQNLATRGASGDAYDEQIQTAKCRHGGPHRGVRRGAYRWEPLSLPVHCVRNAHATTNRSTHHQGWPAPSAQTRSPSACPAPETQDRAAVQRGSVGRAGQHILVAEREPRARQRGLGRHSPPPASGDVCRALDFWPMRPPVAPAVSGDGGPATRRSRRVA